jgi:hypothetical protein
MATSATSASSPDRGFGDPVSGDPGLDASDIGIGGAPVSEPAVDAASGVVPGFDVVGAAGVLPHAAASASAKTDTPGTRALREVSIFAPWSTGTAPTQHTFMRFGGNPRAVPSASRRNHATRTLGRGPSLDTFLFWTLAPPMGCGRARDGLLARWFARKAGRAAIKRFFERVMVARPDDKWSSGLSRSRGFAGPLPGKSSSVTICRHARRARQYRFVPIRANGLFGVAPYARPSGGSSYVAAGMICFPSAKDSSRR